MHREKVSKVWQHWGKCVLLLPGAPIDTFLVGDVHPIIGVATPVRLVVDGVYLA